ncbi:MAG: hypothetical protein MI740_07910 [Halanaerobiales bacterium]|nr:hypothetical protein [Halanaerobiales bacterium]
MNKKLLTLVIVLVLMISIVAGCTNREESVREKMIVIGESSSFDGGFAAIYGPEYGNSFTYHYYINNFYQPFS